MAESTPKKVDPGWNDPPILNYDASNPPPKSRITNKRVAFPLTPNQSTIKSTAPQVMLPPLPNSGSVIPPTLQSTFNETQNNVSENK